MKKQSIPIYLYTDRIAIEGTRQECFWLVNRAGLVSKSPR